jgi:arylsulfatase A-like enzyme
MKWGVSRRAFLERLGMGALGGAGLSRTGRLAQAQSPASAIPSKTVPWTAPATLKSPNILFIMVDQMRWPQWLTTAQKTTLQQKMMPAILGKLANHSYVFQEYYTAATVCTASRGTLLTGLYAPQTAVYDATWDPARPQSLYPAFPTWGGAIQALNPAYAKHVWWFGKWHLSLCTDTTPLQPYGFNTRTYPGGAAANPSPDGYPNEGVNGGAYDGQVLASDADIASDFAGWLKGTAPTKGRPAIPWCAAVSFVNPHDITFAPGYSTEYFPADAFPPPSGAPALYSAVPSPWNYENLNKVTSKPPLQLAYLNTLNNQLGTVTDWAGFLNQYYWLLNYVDQQVDRVLEALAKSVHANNTIIVFTSDHGEFAGSHGLHNKGNAVYEEGIHVPLYVNFPGQTGAIDMHQMCSSVDMFGLLCDLATGGSGQWQTAYADLATRQSLWSFLYSNSS